MSVDILEGLRAKEEEISVLLDEARLKAAAIREAAIRQAQEIKTVREVEAQALIRAAAEEQDRLMRQEAAAIESGAAEDAKARFIKGSLRLDVAVAEVVKIVSAADNGIR